MATLETGMTGGRTAEIATDYEAYYRHFAPRGRRYAYSLLRNSADSEEVVHEAFCRLLRSHQQLRSVNGSFAPLFFTTIRNLCIDARRAAGRRPQVPLHHASEALSVEATEAVTTISESASDDLEQIVAMAMNALPPMWAEAMRLRMRGELSYQQIAEVLGCTHAQVRTWIFRARQQLADTFRRRGILPNDVQQTWDRG